jgi:hypothetical protein
LAATDILPTETPRNPLLLQKKERKKKQISPTLAPTHPPSPPKKKKTKKNYKKPATAFISNHIYPPIEEQQQPKK